MARPPLTVGTWGRITRTQEEPGRWVARCRFRDFDGKTRQVAAWGRTGAEAERRLLGMLKDRAAPAGDTITADTKLAALAHLWLREVDESKLATTTRRRYREIVELHIEPGVGALRVREATVSALDRFLRSVSSQVGAPTAKHCKSVLSGMMKLAARNGAAAANIVRDTTSIAPKAPTVRALTVTEVRALRVALRTDKKAVRADLPALVDVLLGTGMRIGEALALRWSDVDLISETPTLVVSGTVVRVPREGLTIQDHPKSKTSRRRLALPAFVVDSLLERKVNAEPNAWDVVFPSRVGTLRDATNVADQWRDARQRAGFDWVTPHTFRKSVATLLGAKDMRTAARQLGHAGTEVTERHYVARVEDAPDSRAALSAFGESDDSAHRSD